MPRKETQAEKKLDHPEKAYYSHLLDVLAVELRPRLDKALEEYNRVADGVEAIFPVNIRPRLHLASD